MYYHGLLEQLFKKRKIKMNFENNKIKFNIISNEKVGDELQAKVIVEKE